MQESSQQGRLSTSLPRRLSRKLSREEPPLRKNSGQKELPSPEELSNIYLQTQHILETFDSEIKKCKRFNEVKTYRKYEVIIRDLEIQNEQLAAKLKKEELMRSPTKEYIADLLNKIIELKHHTEQLNTRIDELNQTIKQKDQEIREHKLGIVRQDRLLRANMAKLPQLEQKITGNNDMPFRECVRKYAEAAEKNATSCCLPVGKFVGFLHSNIEKFKSLEALLRQTSKWCDSSQGEPRGSVTMQPTDLWRAKYNISKVVSEKHKSPSPLTRERVSLVTLDNSYVHSRPLKTETGVGISRRGSQI